MQELKEFERQVLAEDDLAIVIDSVRVEASKLGVVRQSYHVTPVFDDPVSARTIVHSDGFDPRWLERYQQFDFRKVDPIPRYTIQRGTMTFWQDALDACMDQPGVAEYKSQMIEFGLLHGFGIPLFGTNGRSAYASYDFDVPRDHIDQLKVLRIRTMAQIAHQRVCAILSEEKKPPVLSDREKEVLRWIGQGKSNADIATILDISIETVRTYLRRIYMKLDVYDRTSATVKSLKLGILRNTGE